MEFKNLLDLIVEEPYLPVIPFVNSEVVADDCYCYWMGQFYGCKIDEYLIPTGWEGYQRPIIFRSDNDVIDTLETMLTDDEFEALPEDDDGCQTAFDALPWKKAIFVYITTPES